MKSPLVTISIIAVMIMLTTDSIANQLLFMLSTPLIQFDLSDFTSLILFSLIISTREVVVSSFSGHDRIFMSRRSDHRRRQSTTKENIHNMIAFKNFEQVLDTYEEPLVIYFSSPSCGPCRIMNKEVKILRESVGDEIKVFSLDAERWPAIGSRFKVGALPCLVVFRKGEILTRFEGIHKSEDILKKVQGLL